jgi:hypothetical protein
MTCSGYALLASPTFTGTVTLPDGSTFTSAGHNNLKTLGIGIAAPTASNMVAIQGNYNNNTNVAITNATAGAAAYGTYYLYNDLTHYGSMQLGSSTSGDALSVQTNGAGGLGITSATSAPINLSVGGSQIASVKTTGLSLSTGDTYQVNGAQVLAGDANGGAWTPTDASGAGLTFSSVSVHYTRLGNLVFVYGRLTYPATGNTATAIIAGLPFPVAAPVYAATLGTVVTVAALNIATVSIANTSSFEFSTLASSALTTNNQLSGAVVIFSFFYPVS